MMPYRLRITQEEVRQELANMGYTDLPDDIVADMRRDLLKLIKSDLRRLKQKEKEEAVPGVGSGTTIQHKWHSYPTHPSYACDASPVLKTKFTKPLYSSLIPTSCTSEDKDESTGESGYSDHESTAAGPSASHSRPAPMLTRETTAEGGHKKPGVSGKGRSLRKLTQEVAAVSHKESERILNATTKSQSKKTNNEKQREKKGFPKYPSRPDPVNLYHYYKTHWDQHKPPGEDPHLKLRWAIRSKLFYAE